MDPIPFLTIDDQTLSLEQSLGHLRTAGKLQTVLVEITQQYLLQQEIQLMDILEPSSELVEQFILEFRLQQQLTEPGSFQLWLATNGITYSDFRQQVSFRLQREDLKEKVTASRVLEAFEQQKENLDRFVLSRIVVDSAELAQALKEKSEQGADFSQLAKEHSLVDDAIVGGVMAPVIRAQMPEVIREATRSAQPGQLIGPLQIDQRYCLLKVEQCLPATLEGSLKREIEEQIFQQWLTERLQQVAIKLNISELNFRADQLID
jgi:parvulin-like peptidyl-prolyl isomerase